MRDDAHRTRIILAAVTVLTGGALAGWVHIRSCRIESCAQARARKAITEAGEREAALIAAIGRLSGSRPTGPMPSLRDAA